jgi:ankyrin repeat protein
VLRWLKGKARIRNIVVGKSTLFHIAIKNNNLDIAKMFIASGVDVNQNKCQCRKRRDPAS